MTPPSALASRLRRLFAQSLTLSGLLVLAVAARTSQAGAASPDPAIPPVTGVEWLRPVPGAEVRPFHAPATRYGRGHRGVDLAAAAGAPVRATSAGRVTFAGRIAGRSLVVIRHPGGVSSEYEPVAPAVHVGANVGAGELIGRISGTHAGCGAPCLHWGAKRESAYFDPLVLLAPLAPVRLLPWYQARV